MKKSGVFCFFLFLVLLLSDLVYAECSGIKLLGWKATGAVYTTAVVRISNTSDKTKSVYIVCKHNDGRWYKVLGDKIKVMPLESVEKEVKTGGTWTSIIDMKVSHCE